MTLTTKKLGIYEKLIFVLLFWIILQDFVLSFCYKATGSTLLTNIFFYSKDVIFIVLFVWSLFRGVPKQIFFGLLVFLFCLIFSGITALIGANIGLFTLLQNIRNVILLPCFICIGYAVKNRDNFIQKFTHGFFNFIFVCAIIGFLDYVLDYLIGTVDFWRDTVGVTRFLTDIKGQGVRLVQGLPGNFYGQYGNEFFSVKRLVSIWMNPLTAAYLLALPFVFYSIEFMRNRKSRTLWKTVKILFLGLCIYFTHTRAIIIILAGLFVLYLIQHPTQNHKIFLSCLLVVGFIVVILYSDKLIAILYDGSTLGHINGIIGSSASLKFGLFGGGFGQIGISGDVGSESQYLTVLGNMGIIGLLVYLYFLIYPLVRIKKASKQNTIFTAIIYIGVCYIITGIISEQLSAYTTIVPYYIILGTLMRQAVVKKSQKNFVKSNEVKLLTR